MISSLQGFKFASVSSIFQETLELLQWQIFCEQVSTFASTAEGIGACKVLSLPQDLNSSRLLLAETIEIGELDQFIEGGLSFNGVYNLKNILRRCSKGGVVSGEDLLKVAETLSSARRLRRQIDDSEKRPIITKLLSDLATLPELEKLLRFGLEEGGRIADRASARLAGLRSQLHRLRLERRDCLQELLRRYSSILQDTVVADRRGRPVLAFKSAAVSKIAGMVHDSSASGGTVFLEPQGVIPLGNRIVELEAHVVEEEQRLLAGWSAKVGEHFVELRHLCEVMLHLDLALARARYGAWLGGVAPTLREEADSPFILKDLRHPLLVWQERYAQGLVVVPVTVEVPSDLRVVAITGPNTGGKTVTLKSVGLAVLMARAGFLLPCSGRPSLPWCDLVLADIGDEQSLQQNLSTFSSHIVRIGRILKAIDESFGPNLILLDEVGAGTDPSEGSALAIALLKTLADRARLTIATTHFGELKAIKYSDSRFENASVAFDSKTITPTYHLQWGIPGRSNALSVAKRLGLDPEVTQMAQELIGSISREEVNDVIAGLEEQRRRQQEASERAAALLARTELLHEDLLNSWEQQREQSAQFQERGRQELRKSILDGKKEVRQLIRQLREKGAGGETARQVGQKLRRLEAQHGQMPIVGSQKQWLPQLGDRVRLLALGKAGEIISISDDGRQLTVICGLFRSTVELTEVETLDGIKATPPVPVVNIKSSSSSISGSSVRTSLNTLDVRGLRVHEAEAVVEEYLRNAVGPFWVIHGIGTGKLKEGLRKWLGSLPYVERVVDAAQNEGGAGCSVVWLR